MVSSERYPPCSKPLNPPREANAHTASHTEASPAALAPVESVNETRAATAPIGWRKIADRTSPTGTPDNFASRTRLKLKGTVTRGARRKSASTVLSLVRPPALATSKSSHTPPPAAAIRTAGFESARSPLRLCRCVSFKDLVRGFILHLHSPA